MPRLTTSSVFLRLRTVRNLLIALAIYLCNGAAMAGAYDDIIAAANTGDTAVVMGLLNRGMDVNTADSAGNTLLMLAVRDGYLTLMDALLVNRANINRRNQFGDTALMLGALKARLEPVRRLIDAGADLNGEGWTPLHYAIFGGHKEVIALLIAKGAMLDARAPNGQTALMLAVKLGALGLVQQLIDADADMDLADFDGLSPLRLALKLGHGDIAAYLRSEGADE